MGEAQQGRPHRSRRTRGFRYRLVAAASSVSADNTVDDRTPVYAADVLLALCKSPRLHFLILAALDGGCSMKRMPRLFMGAVRSSSAVLLEGAFANPFGIV